MTENGNLTDMSARADITKYKRRSNTMRTFEGKLTSNNIKIGIVASRFNEFITSKLISGAMDGLIRHDVPDRKSVV